MGNILRKSIQVGGRAMTLETGRMAKQASGAVFCTYGDTAVLVTAVGAKEPKDGVDFFPLTVDYEEKLYAAGKIPGGFLKREGKASEKAILSSRLIDRPIRPLFPKGYHNDVQVVATVLSVDMDNAPDVLAMVGASAALHLSQVPFMGPIAGVVVGLVDGEFIINPNQEQEEKSLMHLTVAGTADAVMMVEAGAKEVPEATILDAIMFGHEEIKKIVAAIEEFRTEALALELAKEKVVPELKVIPEEIEATTEKTEMSMTDFEPYKGKIRKPGTGCITEINDHLFEGRYSPMWVDGKKRGFNVYAKNREEVEVKLEALIVNVKAEKKRLLAEMATEKESEDGTKRKKK